MGDADQPVPLLDRHAGWIGREPQGRAVGHASQASLAKVQLEQLHEVPGREHVTVEIDGPLSRQVVDEVDAREGRPLCGSVPTSRSRSAVT